MVLKGRKAKRRGLHGPGLGPKPVPGGGWEMIFQSGRAGPANEGWFLQQAVPGRQMRDDFHNGPGRIGKERNEFFNGRVWLQQKEDK